MIETKTRTVTDIRLPLCRYGFRSGWAFAVVDDKTVKLHTSKSDRSDYRDHVEEVREAFAEGKGEPAS